MGSFLLDVMDIGSAYPLVGCFVAGFAIIVGLGLWRLAQLAAQSRK
jgi:hypothetical protein